MGWCVVFGLYILRFLSFFGGRVGLLCFLWVLGFGGRRLGVGVCVLKGGVWWVFFGVGVGGSARVLVGIFCGIAGRGSFLKFYCLGGGGGVCGGCSFFFVGVVGRARGILGVCRPLGLFQGLCLLGGMECFVSKFTFCVFFFVFWRVPISVKITSETGGPDPKGKGPPRWANDCPAQGGGCHPRRMMLSVFEERVGK